MSIKERVQEIERKLEKGEAVVLTATELKERLAGGEEIDPDSIDVVTCGTCGLMSGTYLALSFGFCGKDRILAL